VLAVVTMRMYCFEGNSTANLTNVSCPDCRTGNYFEYASMFCEGKHGQTKLKIGSLQINESISAITALWISFVGFYGLFRTNPDGQLLHVDDLVLISSIAANGVGSAWFHATNAFGPGLLDGVTMLVAVALSFCKMQMVMLVAIKNEKDFRHHSFTWQRKLGVFIMTFYAFMCVTATSGSDTKWAFELLFAIPALLIWIPIAYFNRGQVKPNDETKGKTFRTRLRLLFAGILTTTAAPIWAVSELICISDKMFWIHGMIWHLCTPIGLYNIWFCSVAMEHQVMPDLPNFTIDESGFFKTLFPLIHIKEEGATHRGGPHESAAKVVPQEKA